MEVLKDVGAWEKIIKHSLDIIGTVDRNGFVININDSCKSVLGYKSSELIGFRFHSFIHSGDLNLSLGALQNVVGGTKVNNFRIRLIHKNGKEVPMSWSAVWSEEEEVILCVGRDLTEQVLAKQKIQNNEEFYHALAVHGSEMTALFDKDLNYIYSGPSSFKELGYLPEEFIGKNVFSFIHPEDIPMIQESVSKGFHSGEKKVKISEFRFKDAKGEWRWFESIGSNQLQNPAVKALVVNSRDVTDRVNNRIKLQESQQRFKSLFDNHHDMVLFQNKDRIIVDVNAATLSFFGIQKQNIINRPFSDFLSPEVFSICERTFQEALSGKRVRFEMAIPFEGKGVFNFDVVKIPVVVNGDTIGVYSILRDITEVSQSSGIIKQQAEKLNSILESITDACFTLDKDLNFTYVNNRFEKLFHADRKELLGKNVWLLSPPMIKDKFYKQYKNAVETGKPVSFEGYYETLDQWLQVKVFPSEEGLSIFIDDITERKKSRQELEKLSLVASKTINGVIITDAEGKTEWVNEGFTNLTGYSISEAFGKSPHSILQGDETDKATISRILEFRSKGIPFSKEVQVYKKSGKKLWLLIDVTPVKNMEGEITRYITIQTDITERKETEKKQSEMTKDLFIQNRDLQQFTYIVSHNLRSPVASIMGLAEVLNTSDKSSEIFNASLDYLKKSSDQLDTVLKDLNLILSIRGKKGATAKEEVPLAHVCKQVKDALQEPMERCGGEVILNIEEGVVVSGNKAYLYSIFYNLLSNSIKYRSPDRDLKVNINGYSSKEKGVLISVSDNGLGFDVEKAGENLFKLYKRFHYNSEGRGIGLFLVKTHIEAMDGHIEVDSKVNEGTTFLIYLQ